jgi:histidinol-phosphate aminotransferase
MTMFLLEKKVRENIQNLQAYSSARDEYSGSQGVFLDANENPFGEWNRYPDPQQRNIKVRLSQLNSIPTNQLFIGNGSDEMIDLVFRIFCEPGRDKALVFTPTYGMYEVSAAINNVAIVKSPLSTNFQIDFDALASVLDDKLIKLIFICSPNNPTGNDIEEIDRVLKMFDGLVVVDEAYIDFSKADSMVEKVDRYPNLIVIQTFSKAWGLAGVRVGSAYASEAIISLLNKVKPPYNVSAPNQQVVLAALERRALFEQQKASILSERSLLQQRLKELPMVKKIYPSAANFLLIEVPDADQLYMDLVANQIITRNRNAVVNNCIRITVGSEEENQRLLTVLKSL